MLGKSKSRSEDRDQTSQQIVLSLDSLSYRTGSGTSHPVVKERALLSCRKANRQSLTIAIPLLLVNTLISDCVVARVSFRARGPGPGARHNKGRDASVCVRQGHVASRSRGIPPCPPRLCVYLLLGVIPSGDARSASQRGIRCFTFPSHPASAEQTLYFFRLAFLFISRGAQAPFPIRKRLSSSPVNCPPSAPVNQ